MDRYELISQLSKANKYMFVQKNPYSKRNKKIVKTTLDDDGFIRETIKIDKSIFLFLDTCTWINQAEKGKYDNFLKIADLSLQKDSGLLIHEQLTVEWDRNKEEKIFGRQANLIDDMIKQTTSLRDRVISDKTQKQHLTDLINQASSFKEDQVKYVGNQTIALVEDIMTLGHKITTDDKTLTQAAQWGLKKLPPFASNKNSMGDAVLFLSLMNYLEQFEHSILYFVTDNKDDFSKSKVYPDIHEMHSHFIDYANEKGIEIRYFINLEEALNHILEEVTDHEYLAECEALYQEELNRLPKCNKCGEVKVRNTHDWDGRGNKIYYTCINGHLEETDTYLLDEIY